MSDEPDITAASIFFGFLIGLVIGFVMFVADFVLGSQRSHFPTWTLPVGNALAIALIGGIAIRDFNSSGIARGIVIAMALGFLLNGFCGVLLTR